MPRVLKSQLIEVILPGVTGGNTSQKLQFPDFPYLRNRQIFGIETVNADDCPTSPTGKTVCSSAMLSKTYLTLYLDDMQNVKNVGEWIQNVPLTLLHRTQTAATSGLFAPFVRQMYELNGQVIYWEKCYLSLGVAYTPTTSNDVSFMFNVYFK